MDGRAISATARRFGLPLRVKEALAHTLAVISPLSSAVLPLAASGGLVLTASTVAGILLPPFRNAAIDDYAVRTVKSTSAEARSSAQPAALAPPTGAETK